MKSRQLTLSLRIERSHRVGKHFAEFKQFVRLLRAQIKHEKEKAKAKTT